MFRSELQTLHQRQNVCRDINGHVVKMCEAGVTVFARDGEQPS